ncbi:MAG TPA: ATP12 family protein [Stellaceae bacterium]|nr:ATP12 family protein [Stellaceae bacterium]
MKPVHKNAAACAFAGGFTVMLQDKPIMTPAKAPLVLRSGALAEAIAAEWRAQGDRIKPAELPLTRIASTAIDRVQPHRMAVVREIAKYAGTDLVCYRAERPPELAERQRQAWQPILDWAASRYAPLTVTQGVAPVTQPAPSLAAYAAAVEAYDAMLLTALSMATPALGSLVLALALFEGRIGPEEAFAAAELDQTFQIEQWGEDPEQAKRRAGIRAEIDLVSRFIVLHRTA